MFAAHVPMATLNAFALGKLPDTQLADVEAHLADCADCQAQVIHAPGDTFTTLLAAAETLKGPAPLAQATPMGGLTAVWDQLPPTADLPAPLAELPAELRDHPRFIVQRRLGAGGMGAVYLAQHKVMRRPVALKVMRGEFSTRADAAERFHREVQAAAKLQHPNIVAAYDAELVNGTLILVLEYVDGHSLDVELRAGPVAVAEACRAVRDAARGLQHAHAAGLVHRDVKPHNLIRTADGTVKVLDFGLAGWAANTSSTLTGANVVVGTPDYIAPEQALDAHTADARADLYSLGCTLFHLLTGKPPFAGPSVLAVLLAQRSAVPPVVPNVPTELAGLVQRLLAKRPEERYQTAAEVAAALEPFCAPTAAPKPPPRQPRSRLFAVAVGVLALAAAVPLLLNGFVIVRDKDGNEVARVAIPKGGKVEVVGVEGKVDPPADAAKAADVIGTYLAVTIAQSKPETLSPNGQYLASVNEVAGHHEEFVVRSTATGKVVRKVRMPGEYVGFGCFSIDNTRFITSSFHHQENRSRFRVWSLTGAADQDLDQVQVTEWTSWPAWSGDGRYLAFYSEERPGSGHDRIRIVELATGRVIVDIRKPDNSYGMLYATLSADGQRALVGISTEAGPTLELRLIDLTTSKVLQSIKLPRPYNGRRPIYPLPLLTANEISATFDSQDWETTAITWDATTGKELRRWTMPGGTDVTFFARERLIVNERPTADGTFRIRVLDRHSGATVFAAGPFENYQRSCLSADGSVLCVRANGKNILYRLPVTTPSAVRDWAPAGSLQWADAKLHFCSIRPDGRRVVASTLQEVRGWDTATGQEVFRRPGLQAHYTADGKHLLILETFERVIVTNATTGATVRVFDLGDGVHGVDVLADGRHLVGPAPGNRFTIWDYATGRPVKQWTNLKDASWCIAPGGQSVLLWLQGNTTPIEYNPTTKAEAKVFTNTSAFEDITPGPGNRWAIGRRLAGTVPYFSLVDLTTGASRHPIPPADLQTGSIVSFMPWLNERQSVVTFTDGSVRLLDLVAGTPIARHQLPADDVALHATSTPDGKTVLVMTKHGRVVWFHVPPVVVP
jgi:WD40 repeat protein